MGMQVIITLPDNIYRQAELLAQTTNRPVAEVLAETIRQAFPPVHVDADRAAMQQEVANFEASHAELWQQYPRQYVAVHQGQVIDNDADELALVERIEASCANDVVLIRQVLPQLPEPLRYRSPRFVSQP